MERLNGFKLFGFRLVVFLARYNARTSYRKKKKVVPQSLNQSRAEGIEERNVAIESQKLEEAGKAAVNGNNGGCKKISGFVDNETLWMLGKCLVGTMAKDCSTKEGNNSRSTSQKLEKISNSAIAPEKDICINGNEDLQNSHLWASEPASPVSRGPSWVEVVEKTMDLAHVEQPGDNVVASQNPIQERRKRDKVVSEVERRKRVQLSLKAVQSRIQTCKQGGLLYWRRQKNSCSREKGGHGYYRR
ncbi:hypothetical protein V6N13_092359 [Hibiscus sabdariffa]